MDELELMKNDFIALFEGYPENLDEDLQHKMMTSTIGNLFDYLRRLERKYGIKRRESS